MAYRFFLVARLADGEGFGIWLPQGQLTSLIELLLYWPIVYLTPNSIFLQVELMGASFGAVVILLLLSTMITIAVRKEFSLRDIAGIAVFVVVTVYVFEPGVYYTMQPDYTLLDLALYATAIGLFVHYAGADQPLTLGRAIWAGAFAGLLASNKLSMPPIAMIAVAPLILRAVESRRWREIARFIAVHAATLAAVFGLVIIALYGFRLEIAAHNFGKLLSFAAHPGASEMSSVLQVWDALWRLRFGYVLLGAMLIVGALAVSRRSGLVICFVACSALYVYFIFHRPSGSTLFESSTALAAIGVMAASQLPGTGNYDALVRMSAVASVLAAVVLFPYLLVQKYKKTVAESVARQSVFDAAVSAGRRIVVVIPDNDWVKGGPFVLLLKGSSDFPSWDIPPTRRLPTSVPISFRTEQGGETPNAPYPPDATIVWEEPPNLPHLTDKYPELRRAVEARACRSEVVEARRLWICFSTGSAG